MLRNVHVKNLALIKEADIDFGSGLNILTGETGAGKSIILGSINIALGEKASKSFIRSGSESGLVELLFVCADPRVKKLLEELDIPAEENNILISRKITPDASTARINGTSVTLSNLRRVTSLLVDIHGQHDHQTLLNPVRHLDIVDEFGSGDIAPVRKQFHDAYGQYRSLRSKFREFSQDPAELAKEISFVEFEYNEIEEAGLREGEDTALEEEYRRLSNAEKINEGLQKLRFRLFENADSASARISDALRELNYLVTIDPGLSRFADYLMDLDSISRDMSHDLEHYIDGNAFQEERFRQVHDRLNEINRLKAKYGQQITDILQYKDQLADRLSQLQLYKDHKAELQEEMDRVKAEVRRQAALLSEQRIACAHVLEEEIRRNLQDLNFPDVRFHIAFSRTDKIYENGCDKAEFMISTNIGEPEKPLSRVASGGELSRIMLAIKASIADADQTGTLLFDEIDTGISGRTAQKVAEKLAVLSRSHQLICITHLPQIAAMADVHFAIEKSVSDGSTISGIHRLSQEDSVMELARLISGSEITESTLQSAAEMKAAAGSLKA